MSKNRRIQKYIDRYSTDFNFIKKSPRGESFAFCTVCHTDINIGHGGKTDIATHGKGAKHIERSKAVASTSKLSFLPSSSNDFNSVRAEVLFSAFLLEHNIPIAAADHFSKLLPKMFPNNADVKKYSCGRTKTSHIIKEIASESTRNVVSCLKSGPFSIATDGSNDSDNQLYPIVVTFYDKSCDKICSQLLSLPCLNGDCTGENIAKLMQTELERFCIPWQNCIALSCDNANVMIGKYKGVGAFLKQNHPNLFVWGCMCHLINLAAEKGSAALPISFDELLVDIFYYLKKSSKRKQKLVEFQNLYNSETKNILKHCMTRWLSLGKCLGRLLDQWEGVLHYFKDEASRSLTVKQSFSPHLSAFKIPKINDETNAKPAFKRKSESNIEPTKKIKLACITKDSKKKVVVGSTKSDLCSQNASVSKKTKNAEKSLEKRVLNREERIFFVLSSDLYRALGYFLKNIIKVFEKFNENLQSEDPKIHRLKSDIRNFFSDLLVRFVKLEILKEKSDIDANLIYYIEFKNSSNHKNDNEITIGAEASEYLEKLNEKQKKQFFEYAKGFYFKACDYIISNFPINSDILTHAEVADVSKRSEVKFSSVKFFIDKFPVMLKIQPAQSKFEAIDCIEAEFLNYQLTTLPEDVLNAIRPDVQWAILAKHTDSLCRPMFSNLSNVMLGVLTSPHSNASCERIFSVVKKNKTDFRSSMNMTTLQSILIAKTQMNGFCFEQNYDANFLKKAKSATYIGLNQK